MSSAADASASAATSAELPIIPSCLDLIGWFVPLLQPASGEQMLIAPMQELSLEVAPLSL